MGLSRATTVYLGVAFAAVGVYFLLAQSTQQVAFEVIGTAAVGAASVEIGRAHV